jgi:hypothetical protein
MKYTIILLCLLAVSATAGVAYNSYERELALIKFDLWEYNTKEKAYNDIKPALEQFAEQVCQSYIIHSVEEYDNGYIIVLYVGRVTYEVYYDNAQGDENAYWDSYIKEH